MTMLIDAPVAQAPVHIAHDPSVECFICHRTINFGAGEAAIVLRHAAYANAFVHEGACAVAALGWIFPEPGYDGPAYGRDPERRRILAIAPADGWAAVMPETPERVLAGAPVRFDPLRFWALVEHADGTRRTEGVVWDEAWLDEPAAAEFPEAKTGKQALLGYSEPREGASPVRMAEWEAMIRSRYTRESRPLRLAA